MADTVILCPIYTANEKLRLNFTYESFARLIIKNSNVKLIQIKNEFQLKKFVKQNSFGEKIYIGMGAGSISTDEKFEKYILMEIKDIKNSAFSIDGDIFFDHSVKNLNWFNIGGKTKILFKPHSLEALIKYLKLYALRGKIFILGNGSNVLFDDETYPGTIIKLGKSFSKITLLTKRQ